jgi:hypothetical protein
VLTAALITVTSLDGQFTRDDWPLCLFILMIGLFGSFSPLSYVERYDRNTERAHIVRDSIDEKYLSGRVKQLHDEADERIKRRYRILRHVKALSGGSRLSWVVLP